MSPPAVFIYTRRRALLSASAGFQDIADVREKEEAVSAACRGQLTNRAANISMSAA